MKVWEVMPSFYIRGGTRSVPKEKKFETISRLGLKHIVCLVATKDPDLEDFEGYEILPISDGKEIPEIRANWIADSIAEYLDLSEPTLIHCHAGRNRTGLIAALVIKRQWLGMSGQQIFEHLRQVRGNILANPVFEEYVRNLK